ncbi:hypothetical protein C6A85_95215, partial [Mycobacterium sp. ITM-2017-0098]
MTAYTSGTVQAIEADDVLLACSTLPRIDHVDVHLVHIAPTALDSPESWMREILEHTSAATRVRLRAGWTMLGIGLHHGEAGTVAGWRITHSSAEYIRLHGDSRLGLTGQLIARVTGDGVVFATVAQLSNP